MTHKHYVITDERGCIVDGFSDAIHKPSEADICINEEGGYQFCLFGIENPALFGTEYMIPLYKWENGEVIERTEDEIAADIAAIPEAETPPTIDERVSDLETENALLKAQINAQTEQMDFYEECIAEMAMIVYA